MSQKKAVELLEKAIIKDTYYPNKKPDFRVELDRNLYDQAIAELEKQPDLEAENKRLKEQHQEDENIYKQVAEHNDTLIAENKRLKVLVKEYERCKADCWPAELAVKNELLRKALEKYGKHSSICKYVQGLKGSVIEDCDCGFEQALRDNR